MSSASLTSAVRLLGGRDEGSSRRVGLRKLTFGVSIRHCGTTNVPANETPRNSKKWRSCKNVPSISLTFPPFLLSFFLFQ